MTTARGAAGRIVSWAADPANPGRLPHLLPQTLPSHPDFLTGRGGPVLQSDAIATEAEAFIRAEQLFWPAPRHDAVSAEVVIDLSGVSLKAGAGMLDVATRKVASRGILVVATGRLGRLATARGFRVEPALCFAAPGALAFVYAPTGAPAPCWAALGGIKGGWLTAEGVADVDPRPWLLRAKAVDPWRGAETSLTEGLAMLAFLHAEARRNARPRGTVGMSRWKRRNIAPYLAGPAGPARHFTTVRAARSAVGDDAVLVLWGSSDSDPGRIERAEDGFIRSVGLGVRHTPPSSLAIAPGGLHFEAEGANSFVQLVREVEFTPDLLVRAQRLRDTVIRRRITKYNLAASAAPPAPDGRQRLLVPGQVEGDASLRHGSPHMKTNAALISAARARHPHAFLLYKPHPDVVTGLRPGAVPADVLALADAVANDVSAEACLDWADKVETLTSLMGFEALLRGKAVATHGRPFYAGWGLTEDLSRLPSRGELSLEALVAAALILYPRYVEPVSGLPAPPEVVIDALTLERRDAQAPVLRFRAFRRRLASSLLNQFG